MTSGDHAAVHLPPADSSGPVIFAARLLSFTLLAALLYVGKVVAIPLALGLLLSFTLKPVVRVLQRCHVPRIIAVVSSVSLVCALVVCVGWVIGSQLVALGNELPAYRENISEKVRSFRGMMKGGAVEKIQGTVETLAAEINHDKAIEASQAAAADPKIDPASALPEDKPVPVYITKPEQIINLDGLATLLPIVDPLTTAALVLVLVVLMLMRWEDLRSRLISFSGHRNLTVATRACDDAGKRITRYLIMQLLLNGSHGVVFATGLYIVGVPYALLWGICAALFRYLPYVGPIVGGALPLLYSLITSDGWVQPLWVAGLILSLELVSNNLLEPWLYGSRLGLSEVGVIMAAVTWTFLWGPVGLVLATPLTVCLVVLGEYVPAFSIFARLLGDVPVLDLHFRFYQRLLAHDEMEATAITRKVVEEKGLEAAIDELFVPALSLAERDQTAGLLSVEDELHVSSSIEAIFERVRAEAEKDKESEDARSAAEDSPDVCAVIWTVNPLAACAGRLLQWLLSDRECTLLVLGPGTLSAEATTVVQEKQPAAVCLLSLSGSRARKERQLTKRLVGSAPGVPLVVACLGAPETMPLDVKQALVDAGASAVPRTLAETCAALRPLIQHTPPPAAVPPAAYP